MTHSFLQALTGFRMLQIEIQRETRETCHSRQFKTDLRISVIGQDLCDYGFNGSPSENLLGLLFGPAKLLVLLARHAGTDQHLRLGNWFPLSRDSLHTRQKDQNKLRWYPQQPQRLIFTNVSEACCEAKQMHTQRADRSSSTEIQLRAF